MRILFVGDVVGLPGRRALRAGLDSASRRFSPDVVVVNGENAAGGLGITPAVAAELFAAGSDVVTSGNHIWDRMEIAVTLAENPRLLRPANYPESSPGRGLSIFTARDGSPVAVLNLSGRLFMPPVGDPFRAVDALLMAIEPTVRVRIVDFHAEATSEKAALAYYLDGRVSAVLGTHTHVQTADERLLPGGTAAISDVGMTGAHDSIIGVDKDAVVERFVTDRPVRLRPAQGDLRLQAVLLQVSPEDGRASAIERVELRENRGWN